MPGDAGHGASTSPTPCRKRSTRRPASPAAASSPDSLGGPVTAPATPRSAMSGKAIVASQFDRAADLINLEGYMRRILMSPFREVQVEVPVTSEERRVGQRG